MIDYPAEAARWLAGPHTREGYPFGHAANAHDAVNAFAQYLASLPPRSGTPDLVRENAEKNPDYAPYCLRCTTFARMQKVEAFYWRCASCGAEHDSRGAAPRSEEDEKSIEEQIDELARWWSKTVVREATIRETLLSLVASCSRGARPQPETDRG